MNSIQQIFQTHGKAFCEQNNLSIQKRKTIAAISQCRTAELGLARYHCPKCPHTHTTYLSCGNRHCPTCDARKSGRWLAKQLDKRLPCHYFLLTFTLPDTLRPLAMKEPKSVYDAMMHASAEALKKLAKDPRHIGAEKLGFSAVLHTWGRQMQYHPHVHIIIPAGGLTADAQQWRQSAPTFLLPVRALSKLYRGILLDVFDKAGLQQYIPAKVRSEDWVVHCQNADSGINALKYLARYVFRVAIDDKRIVEVTDTHVTISYRKVHSKRRRHLKLTVFEFMRRYLLHVLPRGFMKVRHYGFLHPNAATSIDDIRDLVEEARDIIMQEAADAVTVEEPPQLMCPHCAVPMIGQFTRHSYREAERALPAPAG